MRVFVTGEAGFIGRNLPKAFEALGHEVVATEQCDLLKSMSLTATSESCVHRNSVAEWVTFLKSGRVDVIIHNAAVVGTDVVALNPRESAMTNVVGTHTVCRAAAKMEIPVCYLGTSVIYDTPRYQNSPITEQSLLAPGTFYGVQKLAGENIVRCTAKDWLIMRPLFAYGGVGDMNSLIAKGFYAALEGGPDRVDMFLDPRKRKDYMHVNDFCDAVALACHKGLWGNDFNVSAEEPLETGEIVDIMSEVSDLNVGSYIRWHPETDYLGNHLLTSQKFREETGWKPLWPFRVGLRESFQSIRRGSPSYNPLQHLESAADAGIDLKEYFPTTGKQ